MALKEGLVNITVPANADLSAKQYRVVDINSSGKLVAVSSAGARGIGVLQNKPDAADRAATVAVAGVSKAKYGGTVTAGQDLQADANGDVITAASGDVVIGVALVSGVVGDVGSVLLISKHLNA